MSLKLDELAPQFSLPNQDGQVVNLADLKGGPVVLYFYPKDDTPGCTKESCGFRDNLPRFTDMKATILGVSKDGVASHKKFQDKYALPFDLISDESGTMCEDFDVWQEKKNFGKTYMGIVRSTFLLDKHGIVRKIWRNVRVDGHVEAVAEAVAAL